MVLVLVQKAMGWGDNMPNGVVVFDVAEFRSMYPKITATDAQLEMFFLEAELLFNNTEHSCVKDVNKRKIYLYLIVAHLATLQAQVDAGNALVGRISSATEGSVSVSSDYGTLGKNEKYWAQTPYGAKYWALTAPFRTSLYVVSNFPMPVDRRGYPRNRFYNS